MLRLKLLIVFSILFMSFPFIAGHVTGAEAVADPVKTITAHKVTTEIRVDGVLSEADWKNGDQVIGFRQIEPDEGEQSSQKTKVRVLYGDEALYIGFWCADSEPDKIIKLLTRRDRFSESDQVSVRIDAHHDHQTAYYFSINAAGVMRDRLIFNNEHYDDSWDAVWDAEARMSPHGWTAELKIPYSALRFSEAEKYTWGIDFTRYIPRRNETSHWQFVPTRESSGVSRYGHLVGMENLQQPGRLETLPYFVSTGTSEPISRANSDGRDFTSNVGVDVKYALSSSFTLDAAVNPDFGQVEADGAIINLGQYETYFEEKRPFFLEGTEIFSTPLFEQFYTRRIGKAPNGYVDSVDYELDRPGNTTILSAIKLSGKNNKGTALGILNATTQKETMTYMRSGDSVNTHEAVVEPLANYTVARVKQDVGASSYIGSMLTFANQADRTDAYSGSADWQLYLAEEKYRFTGIVVGSNNGPGTSGAASYIEFLKVSGKNHRGSIQADYYDRKVDFNRLGYLNRNGYWGAAMWQQVRSNKKFGPFHMLRLNVNAWYNQLTSKHRFWNGGNVNGWIRFTNNWNFSAGFAPRGSEYDDLETRGKGLWLRPSRTQHWINVNTNPAGKMALYLSYFNETPRDGRRISWDADIEFNLFTNFQFSLGTNYMTQSDCKYWVGNDNASSRPVFGELDNDELSFETRGTYTFNRNLTLQWLGELYISAGEYDSFRTLESADRLGGVMDDVSDVSFSRSDFNYKSFRSNLILRWEYRPGSTLFVVWTHDRDRYDTGYGNFDFSRDVGDTFEIPQTNSLLIKANYWWNL